jgi:hypothetical protein
MTASLGWSDFHSCLRYAHSDDVRADEKHVMLSIRVALEPRPRARVGLCGAHPRGAAQPPPASMFLLTTSIVL